MLVVALVCFHIGAGGKNLRCTMSFILPFFFFRRLPLLDLRWSHQCGHQEYHKLTTHPILVIVSQAATILKLWQNVRDCLVGIWKFINVPGLSGLTQIQLQCLISLKDRIGFIVDCRNIFQTFQKKYFDKWYNNLPRVGNSFDTFTTFYKKNFQLFSSD